MKRAGIEKDINFFPENTLTEDLQMNPYAHPRKTDQQI